MNKVAFVICPVFSCVSFLCVFVSVFLRYKLPLRYKCVCVAVSVCRQGTNVGVEGVCGMLESGLLVYCDYGLIF